MKCLAVFSLVISLSLSLLSVARAGPNGSSTTRTLPTSISIATEPVQGDEATYRFAVALSGYQVVDGVPQLTVTTTITKTAEGAQVSFSAIILQVAQDASSFRVRADGEEFVLEAGYRDPFDRGVQPRQVTTTFGQMFSGGKVGLTARLAD
ncbi:hypothetical protein HQ590_13895 [bacterium]|nr:hypothetical protein [bacterium]